MFVLSKLKLFKRMLILFGVIPDNKGITGIEIGRGFVLYLIDYTVM